MDSVLLNPASYDDTLWTRDYIDADSPSFLLDEWSPGSSVILNDKMFSESIESPSIQTEHSYSLGPDPDLVHDVKVEPIDDMDYQDIDTDLFLNPHDPSSGAGQGAVKQESGESLLKQPTIVLAKPSRNTVLPKVTVKLENPSSSSPSIFGLPPTPPSSSDSEGCASPDRCEPPLPPPPPSKGRTRHSRGSHPSIETSQHISYQEKGSTGEIKLTEEELRTLKAEGYEIPKRLPLTKQEERTLKKIRRKIKNKISAQESRRKKKEYMDTLEKRVEVYEKVNSEYKSRIEKLESQNRALKAQLTQLQTLLRQLPKHCKSTQTSSISQTSAVEKSLELLLMENPQLCKALR